MCRRFFVCKLRAILARAGKELVKHRVLVVDDYEDAADTLAMLLEGIKMDVQVAYDGQQALQLFDAFRPDIILMDVSMPKLDGYQTARMIRQRPNGRAVTLVAITGRGQDKDRRASMEAGFDQHLVKPVSFVDITKLLRWAPPMDESVPRSSRGQ